MLARMQNSLRMIGRQIRGSGNAWATRFTSYERTDRTWAKVIDSYDNIPEVYKEFFIPLLSEGQAFPYTVLTPAYETLGYRITGKLICVRDHEIDFLEENGKGLVAQCYPLEGISFVEMTSMLLDSRVKVNGVTSQGIQSSSIVRFSSATDYLFTPVLRKIRLHSVSAKDVVQNPDVEKFDHWIRLNYKFMNFARNSLLGGEKVICAILQPEISKSMFTILGRTYHRTISPTHVCILTDRELITIREEVLQGRQDKYGGIWDYLPLNKIAGLSMNRKNGDLLALSIQMLTNDRFECLFQASMKDEVNELVDQFNYERD